MRRLFIIFGVLAAVGLTFLIINRDQSRANERLSTQELVDLGVPWHCINIDRMAGNYIFTLQDHTNGLILYLHIQYPYLSAADESDKEIKIYVNRYFHDTDTVDVPRGSTFEAELIQTIESSSFLTMTDEYFSRVSTVISTRDKEISLHTLDQLGEQDAASKSQGVK